MPKVSVINLSEEILEVPPARSSADSTTVGRPGFPWREFFGWVRSGLWALFHHHNLVINILALLIGRVSLMGEMAPFGLALFAAVAGLARKRAAAVGIWALAGVLSAGFYQEGIIYVCSMLLYWRLSDKLSRYEKKTQAIPIFMFGSVFLSSMALAPWRDSSLYGTMLGVFDATLCMVLAFVFQYGAPLFLHNTKIRQISTENLVCGIIMLATAVAGLGGLTIYDYSVRNIAGSLIAMTLAFSGGPGLGASVGVATGLVVGLSDGGAATAIAMYALAGMLGGLFRGLGKPAVLLGFVLGSMIAVIYFGQPGELLLVLVEVSVAGAVFMLVPATKISQWRESAADMAGSVDAAQQTVNAAVDKLNNIADIFKDLAGSFDIGTAKEQSAYNNQIKEGQLAQMLSAVGERVCGPCGRRSDCWDRNFYQTYQAMIDMLALAEAGKLRNATLPDNIREVCANRQSLS
ncbi:MAG: stage II sporulation protein E, partial [Sporomusa sp.]